MSRDRQVSLILCPCEVVDILCRSFNEFGITFYSLGFIYLYNIDLLINIMIRLIYESRLRVKLTNQATPKKRKHVYVANGAMFKHSFE